MIIYVCLFLCIDLTQPDPTIKSNWNNEQHRQVSFKNVQIINLLVICLFIIIYRSHPPNGKIKLDQRTASTGCVYF